MLSRYPHAVRGDGLVDLRLFLTVPGEPARSTRPHGDSSSDIRLDSRTSAHTV